MNEKILQIISDLEILESFVKSESDKIDSLVLREIIRLTTNAKERALK